MATDILTTFSDYFNCSMEHEVAEINKMYDFTITKDQLKIGSILHYYGKDAPNTRWQIDHIWYTAPSKQRYRHTAIHTMNDNLTLYCHQDPFKRKYISFRHISKSPLWRLE